MKRRVAFFEFSIYDQLPLASAYMHSYAQVEQAVADSFEFVYLSRRVERISYEDALSAVRGLNASILCFSCYIWNMGLIKRLVHDLHDDPRIEHIILGGHQVSHHIQQYVERRHHKIIVINGQGEIPFRDVLLRLSDSRGAVGLRGVSLYADGELWNGGESGMVANLEDIPSPFLGGYFDGMNHPITVFETNRGCPYKCTFCTWGGDTTNVTKFSLERIKEELLWIVKRRLLFIYIADANWGMLPRDVEISEYIGQLKRAHGFPMMVYYAAAKNKPKGSLACIEKFHEGGVMTTQALGIQSLNPVTLEKIDRKNIKNEAYFEMFGHLKARSIDSYCELIWPLPGETLETLKAGFGRLVALGAATVIMYPSILINNARLTDEAEQHGMVAERMKDWRSELRVVKSTSDADRATVEDGLWFYYAYYLLANWDLHKGLLHCLAAENSVDLTEVVSDFAAYLRANRESSAFARLVQSVFDEDGHGDLNILGRLATHISYEARSAAQNDVARFTMGQQAGKSLHTLAAFSIWAYSLARLFTNKAAEDDQLIDLLNALGNAEGETFASIVHEVRANGRSIEMDVYDATGVWSHVLPFFHVQVPPELVGKRYRITIDRPSGTLGYSATDASRNEVYAHGMSVRLRRISARLSVASLDGDVILDRTAVQPPAARELAL